MKFKIFKAGLLANFSASSRLSCLALLNVTLRNSPTVKRILIEQKLYFTLLVAPEDYTAGGRLSDDFLFLQSSL